MAVILNRKLGRVGLGMLGLDVHTKGIRTLASRLDEYGADVAFLGEHLTVEYLVAQAKQRDVDLIGISFSSGAYVDHCRDVVKEMRSQGVDVPLMIGGLVHKDDHPALNELGIEGIFGPGSDIEDIVAFIEKVTRERVTRRDACETDGHQEKIDG
ncbi:cobalamin B12-binding domain-containing protein [Rhizorhabdus argentea]|uniref:cobalamin B12-binding domain-containing protein n=1 Tax=Rhizorhabdus argentea TaxID=1387174 RepID=UPI0030EF4049